MKRSVFVGIALFLLAGVPTLPGHGEEPKKVSALMQQKLKHAQKVLEGVALKDFDTITRHAGELMLISKEAEWNVLKTPQYVIHSNEFRRTTEELIKNAKDQNLDAAALSYVDLTLTCVKCHKHVRAVRMTGVPSGRTSAE